MKTDRKLESDNNFQLLLEHYLTTRGTAPSDSLAGHLEPDLLAAFTSGNLTQRELAPAIQHLTVCNFCRHSTAELVRLDLGIQDTVQTTEVVPVEPSVISRFLESIMSGWRGLGDQAVFAHSEDDPENPPEKKDPQE